jgi:hypothetical protein
VWRRKKFIIAGVLAAVLLIGSVGGVALAHTGNRGQSEPEIQFGALLPEVSGICKVNTGKSINCTALLDRVLEIYQEKTGVTIDQEVLKDAFAQAQSERREAALDNYLQKRVDEGKITQEEADQYRAWHQAKPDMEPFRQQLREWQEAKPDVSLSGRFGGHNSPGGMNRGGGFHFWGR